MKPKNLEKPKTSGLSFFDAFRQIGSLTALSRFFGFGRDVIFAITLGSGLLADAFFVAFRLPNLFRRLTAEGAITNAFLPSYTGIEQTSGASAAALFAAEIQRTLLWSLVAITLVLEFAMPFVIAALAPGFLETEDRFNDTVLLARLTVPYMPMVSMVAFWAALTNANDRFLGGALAPIILNILLMAGAFVSSLSAAFGAIPLALSVPIAGIFQMLLMQRMLRAIDKRPSWGFWPKISAAGKLMWRKFFAAALGASGLQLNLLVDTILASLLPVGAISALYYSDRVSQLPLGIIGIALGTALLPRLSRLEALGDEKSIRDTIAGGVRLGLFFAIPSMVGAFVLSKTLIVGLFAYGAFRLEMIAPTADVLVAYSVGIPAFVMAKVFLPSFYAAQDPITPLKITFVSVAFNILASLFLMQILGVVGLALATSLSSWLSVFLLVFVLVRRGRFDWRVCRSFWGIILASFLMGLGLFFIRPVFDNHMMYDGLLSEAFGLMMLVFLGCIFYFTFSYMMGSTPPEITSLLRRSRFFKGKS